MSKKVKAAIGKEIEFKYEADSISLPDFLRFFGSMFNKAPKMYKGYDDFYATRLRPNEFLRHRYGNLTNELTYKAKLTKRNNFIRLENNIKLHPGTLPKNAVQRLCHNLGFTFNCSIYKKSWVFKTERYVVALYDVMFTDSSLEESSSKRFLEIEAREEYPWKSERNALRAILKLENRCKELGLGPKYRVNKSLFEMYRK